MTTESTREQPTAADRCLWRDFVYGDGIVAWLEKIIVRRYGYRPHEDRTARLVNNAWVALVGDAKYTSAKGKVTAYAYGMVRKVLLRGEKRFKRLVPLEEAEDELTAMAERKTASRERKEAITAEVCEAIARAAPGARRWAEAFLAQQEDDSPKASDAPIANVQQILQLTRHRADKDRAQLARHLRQSGLFQSRSA